MLGARNMKSSYVAEAAVYDPYNVLLIAVDTE
jgi:hypothetical protein